MIDWTLKKLVETIGNNQKLIQPLYYGSPLDFEVDPEVLDGEILLHLYIYTTQETEDPENTEKLKQAFDAEEATLIETEEEVMGVKPVFFWSITLGKIKVEFCSLKRRRREKT